jgi:hypothetical protein
LVAHFFILSIEGLAVFQGFRAWTSGFSRSSGLPSMTPKLFSMASL